MADKRLKPKKKNNKSYDNKLITWISVALGAFVAVVIAIVLIITMTTGYVAKVDGLKIYDYEYNFFLQQAMYELQEENLPEDYDEKTDAEKQQWNKEFWTEERRAEVANNALEDARQFKAQYSLARDKGYKLSSEEKNNLKNNITQYYDQYMSYGYTAEMVEQIMFGGMTLSEYKEFAIIQSTIEEYKKALRGDINPSDDELLAVYEKNSDDYRKVSLRKFMIDIGVTKPTDENADDYKTKDDEYKKALEEAKKFAREIIETYNAGEKMPIYKKGEDGKFETDEDGNWIIDTEKEALDFVEFIKTESDDSSSSSTGGLSEINNNTPDSVKEITKYALSMDWNTERTQIVKRDPEDKQETKDVEAPAEEESVMTKLEMIETDTAIYVVRVENIEDFENSKESSEGAKDSIKDVIRAEVVEEKVVEKLEALVNEKGDKYKVESKKEEELKELNDKLFSGL